MLEKLRNAINLVVNMGGRYTIFRVKYEMVRRTGLLKNRFPVAPAYRQYISLDEWKNNSGTFFFENKQTLTFLKHATASVEERYHQIIQGKFLFFNSTQYNGQDRCNKRSEYDIRDKKTNYQ